MKVASHEHRHDLSAALHPSSPKPVLKLASENKLLASPLEEWLSYADARIDTSHDCRGEKAQACLEIMGDFIDDAIGLYQTMSGETWG